jgi:hypothetical protein
VRAAAHGGTPGEGGGGGAPGGAPPPARLRAAPLLAETAVPGAPALLAPPAPLGRFSTPRYSKQVVITPYGEKPVQFRR